jgi:hypothetical protein
MSAAVVLVQRALESWSAKPSCTDRPLALDSPGPHNEEALRNILLRKALYQGFQVEDSGLEPLTF